MLAAELIRRKRDGAELSADEVAAFVDGLTSGTLSGGQAAAFAMAVFFRGMTRAETVALTLAMRDSGAVLDWRALGIDGPVIDKHSTGGVGDKVSLILAPLLAACGASVPMISGRGLGHTGGTLDKMDAIPGYRSQPPRDDFVRAVREAGCAIVGATDDLAPADRRLYAIRDVTATVESLPLITASVLAKKLAGGAHALVLDVKVGSGAFMTNEADAMALAQSLVEVATGAGMPARALLTDMDQPLGRSIGNALELREAIDVLRSGSGEPRLMEVTLALAEEALLLAGMAYHPSAARFLVRRALEDGAAAERFARSVATLGGPADLLDDPDRHLPSAAVVVPVHPPSDGWVGAVDARALGIAVIELGGGRARADDRVDHAVGLSEVASVGTRVGGGRPLCLLHAADGASARRGATRVRDAFEVAQWAPEPGPVVLGRVGG